MKEPDLVDDMKGPVLNLGSPQSALGPKILGLVEHLLLQDPAYVERIKQHYRMFKEKIDAGAEQQSANADSDKDRWKKLSKATQQWLKRREKRRSRDGAI